MEYDVIKYYENSESESPEEKAPSIIFCKFMIIINADTAYFTIGDIGKFPYHANIVDRFCKDRDIPAAWKRKPDVVEIYSEETELKGGGMVDIDENKKILKIYGYSTAYGPTNVEYLKGFVINHPFFEEYSVRFR